VGQGVQTAEEMEAMRAESPGLAVEWAISNQRGAGLQSDDMPRRRSGGAGSTLTSPGLGKKWEPGIF
jgi:hypothetical protein